jgi:hypothetical protein
MPVRRTSFWCKPHCTGNGPVTLDPSFPNDNLSLSDWIVVTLKTSLYLVPDLTPPQARCFNFPLFEISILPFITMVISIVSGCAWNGSRYQG